MIIIISAQIEKLKNINQKLRNKIKELNVIVEKAIDKANSKKLSMHKKDNQQSIDVEHILKIREKEISNSEK